MVLDPCAYHEVNDDVDVVDLPTFVSHVEPSLHEHYETELAALNGALMISPLRFSLVSGSLGFLRLHFTSPEISFHVLQHCFAILFTKAQADHFGRE
jgi:hypothetical protein